MNTRIEKDFVFQAAVHFQNRFLLNIYELAASMLVQTESIHEQNVAMERLNYYLSERLENSVFVDQTAVKTIDKYAAAGINVCSVPEEPYDQIIALLLLSKMNAMMEGKIVITDMVLSSKLSDGVKFVISDEMSAQFMDKNGWWANSSPSTCDISNEKPKKDKIVKLFSHHDWMSLGLAWKEKSAHNKNDIVSILEPEK